MDDYIDSLNDCWHHANPDEDERTDDEVEACYTVDEATRQVVSVRCYRSETVIVAGNKLIHLSRGN